MTMSRGEGRRIWQRSEGREESEDGREPTGEGGEDAREMALAIRVTRNREEGARRRERSGAGRPWHLRARSAEESRDDDTAVNCVSCENGDTSVNTHHANGQNFALPDRGSSLGMACRRPRKGIEASVTAKVSNENARAR